MSDREVTMSRPTGAPVTADRAFIPPPTARGLVADDLLSVSVSADDKGISVDTVEIVDRPRRMLAGTLVDGPGRVVLEPDPSLSTGWIDLDTSVVSAAAGRPGSIVVVLRAEDGDGKPVGRALVAGPFVAGSPKAVRAVATVVAYERAAPGLVAGGPAIAGLDEGDAALTHARFVGIVAGGGRGAATGLATRVVAGEATADNVPVADRTDEWCVTVDAASSRDLDDAVGASWSGADDDPVAVQVHIADVAAVVDHDSAADRYARTIAASMYPVVGDNAPMFDPELSEDQLSLLPGQQRNVLSVRMLVDRHGEVTLDTVEAATIISGARLTYRAVEQWLAGDDTSIAGEVANQRHTTGHDDHGAVVAVVAAMTEAARRLGHHRDRRLTFDDLFAAVELDPVLIDGRLATTEAEPHAEAYRLIERLMVAANETVASFLVDHGIPALYRVHEGLDPQRLDRLAAAVEAVGVSLPALDPDSDPTDVMSDVLAAVDQLAADGRSDERNLLIAVATGTMARASYDAEPGGHRGLASGAYTHFTSPIRRYADLVVHRQLRAAIAGSTPPWNHASLGGLARWLDHRADASGLLRATERRALWALLLDRGHADDTLSAVITGLTNHGLRIRLPRIGLGGFITAERALGLPAGQRGSLVVDDHQLTTTSGPWRVGGTVSVRFVGLDATDRPIWRLA